MYGKVGLLDLLWNTFTCKSFSHENGQFSRIAIRYGNYTLSRLC